MKSKTAILVLTLFSAINSFAQIKQGYQVGINLLFFESDIRSDLLSKEILLDPYSITSGIEAVLSKNISNQFKIGSGLRFISYQYVTKVFIEYELSLLSLQNSNEFIISDSNVLGDFNSQVEFLIDVENCGNWGLIEPNNRSIGIVNNSYFKEISLPINLEYVIGRKKLRMYLGAVITFNQVFEKGFKSNLHGSSFTAQRKLCHAEPLETILYTIRVDKAIAETYNISDFSVGSAIDLGFSHESEKSVFKFALFLGGDILRFSERSPNRRNFGFKCGYHFYI